MTLAVSKFAAILIVIHCCFAVKYVPGAIASLWVGKLRHLKGSQD